MFFPGIDDLGLEKAARKVTSTGDVLLRKEIIAALGKKLRTEDRESAHVDSVHVVTLMPKTPSCDS